MRMNFNIFLIFVFFFSSFEYVCGDSIGYPVVTLGFGVKSYVGYRIRHRKQREMSKENEFYVQILQYSLPNDELLNAQLKQESDALQSEKLGEFDLPVSSAITAQRIQEQELLVISDSHAPSSSTCKDIHTYTFILTTFSTKK